MISKNSLLFGIILCFIWQYSWLQTPQHDLQLHQITKGPKHHFFGYIGQCQTIPWNGDGQYILSLAIDSIHRMPLSDEAADIGIIDTKNQHTFIKLDETYGWNPQQGTMFYWHPKALNTQFFFNDKDPETGQVFTVLYDIHQRKRIREYRFAQSPIGNGGVNAQGNHWLGINYGRLARLRLVTGYPGAKDWSKEELAPENDGIFKVNIQSGQKELLVSYAQLDKAIKDKQPNIIHTGLFINHTLWNRTGEYIYFFVRAGWNGDGSQRINIPCSIKSDGSELTLHDTHIGGHPEWGEGHKMIGSYKGRQVYYDILTKEITDTIGDSTIFPDPEGDIALSPNGRYLVNGYTVDHENFYVVYDFNRQSYIRSGGIDKGPYRGNIRIDPAPRWNRSNDGFLIPGIDQSGMRQIFYIKIENTIQR